MFKHFLLALILAGLVYSVTLPAIAQSNGGNDQQSGAAPDHERGRGHFDPAKRTEMLTKRLNLTSDQQAKVLEIFKSEQSQMEALHSDSSLSQEDRRSKMMDIRKASDAQIRALLDAGQQKKYDAMQAEHGQWQGRHQDGQAPSGPGSAQPN
jgi:periplasmic protein CpxP/Spy